ncbi:hypothetical protein CYMTET_11990 [Cymbomonas tetramitiformis]|uniref:PH domain-containing protein n=1 Tax=Cymbomonas tetramitiformis TaxID=36881 RepID=A0AAE0LCX1_9CHLO|nr:hypothetical protein CYMTET_11990 [Cymbomonas tetramitiformis]
MASCGLPSSCSGRRSRDGLMRTAELGRVLLQLWSALGLFGEEMSPSQYPRANSSACTECGGCVALGCSAKQLQQSGEHAKGVLKVTARRQTDTGDSLMALTHVREMMTALGTLELCMVVKSRSQPIHPEAQKVAITMSAQEQPSKHWWHFNSSWDNFQQRFIDLSGLHFRYYSKRDDEGNGVDMKGELVLTYGLSGDIPMISSGEYEWTQATPEARKCSHFVLVAAAGKEMALPWEGEVGVAGGLELATRWRAALVMVADYGQRQAESDDHEAPLRRISESTSTSPLVEDEDADEMMEEDEISEPKPGNRLATSRSIHMSHFKRNSSILRRNEDGVETAPSSPTAVSAWSDSDGITRQLRERSLSTPLGLYADQLTELRAGKLVKESILHGSEEERLTSPDTEEDARDGGDGVPGRMEGWLKKRGQTVKSWKERWFVLDGLELSYYSCRLTTREASTNGGVRNLKGKVTLTDGRVEISSDTTKSRISLVSGLRRLEQHRIILTTKDGRQLHMSTESVKDLTLWYKAISATIDGARLSTPLKLDFGSVYRRMDSRIPLAAAFRRSNLGSFLKNKKEEDI